VLRSKKRGRGGDREKGRATQFREEGERGRGGKPIGAEFLIPPFSNFQIFKFSLRDNFLSCR